MNRKLGCAFVVSLTLGLAGCWMDEEPREAAAVDYSTSGNNLQRADTAVSETPAAQKSYASKDPVQKSAPGPKRAAAPKIPVL